MTAEMAVLGATRRLLHFAKDERAFNASGRFLSPETDSVVFLVVRAGAGLIVRETALSSCSQPFASTSVPRLTVEGSELPSARNCEEPRAAMFRRV